GKSVDTKFEKSSVIRQPNAFKSQRPSVLGKSTTFSNSFVRKDFSKSTSVTQTHVSNDFSKPVTAQTLPANKKSILKNTNVLAPGMYKFHTYHTQTRTSQLPQESRKTNKRKPRNFTRKLYERVSKTCSWWYPKFTQSGYIWKPKSKKENVNPNVSMPLGNASKTANVMDTMTSKCSTVSNTPLSSNSFAARRDCPIHHRLWVLKAHDGKSQAFN
nr:hypothetical protein [Tanacetum cinerariifolium]